MPLPLLAIGTALSLAGGAQSFFQGKRQQKEARGLKTQRDAALGAIQLEDPREVAVLEETRRRRRAFETGTAFSSEQRNLRAAQAGTQQSIARVGGGGGATLAALGRTQLATARGIAEIGKSATAAQLQLTDLIGSQTQQLVNRKTQIQSLRFQQASADFARRESEANANINAGIASIAGAGSSLLAAGIEGIKVNPKAAVPKSPLTNLAEPNIIGQDAFNQSLDSVRNNFTGNLRLGLSGNQSPTGLGSLPR